MTTAEVSTATDEIVDLLGAAQGKARQAGDCFALGNHLLSINTAMQADAILAQARHKLQELFGLEKI